MAQVGVLQKLMQPGQSVYLFSNCSAGAAGLARAEAAKAAMVTAESFISFEVRYLCYKQK